MKEFVKELQPLIEQGLMRNIATALTIMLVALVIARLIRRSVQLKKRTPIKNALLIQFSAVLVVVIGALFSLRVLGVDLSLLLGAAGILTVALGFASQTSASNIISGLFLMTERPFKVGDLVTIEETTGYVLSIQLLSIRLRTFDNLMVRIPNESVLKGKVTNLTRFPIRRIDLKIQVAYKEDLFKIRELLLELVDKNPLCLDEPRPLFLFLDYGDSGQKFQFSVWTTQAAFWDLKTALHMDVKRVFDAHDIEIPFPQRSLHAGSTTAPFPVKIVSDE